MSKLTTALSFELSTPIEEMQNQIRQTFPQNYKLKKNTFSDSWEIKNRYYKHSLYYSFDQKKGELNTKRRGNIIAFFIGVLFYRIAESLELSSNEWLNTGISLIIVLILSGLINFIWNKLIPSRKIKTEEEHRKIVSIIESLKSKKS